MGAWKSCNVRGNFYPRSPCGERLFGLCEGVFLLRISIHALLAESDCSIVNSNCNFTHFYPRSPCGERRTSPAHLNESQRYFYPRSPCGERPFTTTTTICTVLFLSTLSLRRATAPPYNLIIQQQKFLSTLSLRRATASNQREQQEQRDFYPRSPCGERPRPRHYPMGRHEFLSTLSLRRATFRGTTGTRIYYYFYPRSPCGERHGRPIMQLYVSAFLSTLSLRRAT